MTLNFSSIFFPWRTLSSALMFFWELVRLLRGNIGRILLGLWVGGQGKAEFVSHCLLQQNSRQVMVVLITFYVFYTPVWSKVVLFFVHGNVVETFINGTVNSPWYEFSLNMDLKKRWETRIQETKISSSDYLLKRQKYFPPNWYHH